MTFFPMARTLGRSWKKLPWRKEKALPPFALEGFLKDVRQKGEALIVLKKDQMISSLRT